ncbi:MAG: HEAT repeat domain-containing protein [Anaerolineae bacterium]|nr:HEAT repeat domain-containing protein [Anaerolineae bacterium]
MPEQTHQVKQVIAELRDVNKERRRTAIMKLGMIGGEEALRTLIYVVSNKHEDLIVRGRAAMMLGNLRDTRAVEPLIEALTAPGYQTPLFAAEALGKIGDPRAIPALEPLLQSEHDRYREVAGQALRRLQRKDDEQQQEIERTPEPSA